MGTVVTIEVIGHGETEARRADRAEAVARAVEWFQHVERCCSRFDPESELRQLSDHVGVPVAASATTLEAVRFALALADETGGAFDPTVGHAMVARGFDTNYRTGESVTVTADISTYRDVELNANAMTITLHRPLHLDLGAVAKGLAIDMAARELGPLEHFAINAGGDVFVSGLNAAHDTWSIGIRHPRDERSLLTTVRGTNVAVCTSGDYERKSRLDVHAHHILDARTGQSAGEIASVTVIAPLAMVADGLSTAAFVLGPHEGLALLERQGVDGLVVTPALERFETQGWPK
jgi:thiamine biosynthesis lipoprotein